MAKCLHELPARYKSVRTVIQKARDSSSAYNFSVSLYFAPRSLIWTYDAFSVGVCSKNEHVQQNQELKAHTDVRETQFKKIHESQRNTAMIQWFAFVSRLLIHKMSPLKVTRHSNDSIRIRVSMFIGSKGRCYGSWSDTSIVCTNLNTMIKSTTQCSWFRCPFLSIQCCIRLLRW